MQIESRNGGLRVGGAAADGANALIVGYGRFGQTVGQMLVAQGIPVTLIDTDIEMIDVAGSFGAKVYYGDGTRLDLLRQAGAAEASRNAAAITLLYIMLPPGMIDRGRRRGIIASQQGLRAGA